MPRKKVNVSFNEHFGLHKYNFSLDFFLTPCIHIYQLLRFKKKITNNNPLHNYGILFIKFDISKKFYFDITGRLHKLMKILVIL